MLGGSVRNRQVAPRRPEVMRLPGNRLLILYRGDILRYPVLATKIDYRLIRHWSLLVGRHQGSYFLATVASNALRYMV